MTDTAMWDLIVGFLSATFVLPIIQQPHWSDRRRSLVTFVYSVVVGLVTAYLTGAYSGVHDLRSGVTSALLTLVSAVATYKGFAKPSGIAPTVERATSGAP